MAHREWTERHIRELVQRELKKKKSGLDYSSLLIPQGVSSNVFMQQSLIDRHYPISWKIDDPMELPNEFYDLAEQLPNNQIRTTTRGSVYGGNIDSDTLGNYILTVYLTPRANGYNYYPDPPSLTIQQVVNSQIVTLENVGRGILVGKDSDGENIVAWYIIKQNGKYYLPIRAYGKIVGSGYDFNKYTFGYLIPYDLANIQTWEESAVGFFTDWSEFEYNRSFDLIYNGWYVWNS